MLKWITFVRRHCIQTWSLGLDCFRMHTAFHVFLGNLETSVKVAWQCMLKWISLVRRHCTQTWSLGLDCFRIHTAFHVFLGNLETSVKSTTLHQPLSWFLCLKDVSHANTISLLKRMRRKCSCSSLLTKIIYPFAHFRHRYMNVSAKYYGTCTILFDTAIVLKSTAQLVAITSTPHVRP